MNTDIDRLHFDCNDKLHNLQTQMARLVTLDMTQPAWVEKLRQIKRSVDSIALLHRRDFTCPIPFCTSPTSDVERAVCTWYTFLLNDTDNRYRGSGNYFAQGNGNWPSFKRVTGFPPGQSEAAPTSTGLPSTLF